MSEVRVIYLKEGTQIIGDTYYNEASDAFTVSNPLMAVQAGPRELGFVEYLQFTDETTAIFAGADVRHTFDAKPDLVEYWNKNYGSGIITPPSGLITG